MRHSLVEQADRGRARMEHRGAQHLPKKRNKDAAVQPRMGRGIPVARMRQERNV